MSKIRKCIHRGLHTGKIKSIKGERFTISFTVMKEYEDILLLFRKMERMDLLDENDELDCDDKIFEEMDFSEIASLLNLLYGGTDPFFDDYKCSFNYTFDCRLFYKENQDVCFDFLLRIRDWKGYLEFLIHLEKDTGDEIEIKRWIIQHEILEILKLFINYHCKLFEKIPNEAHCEFERIQYYKNIKYGFKKGRFFQKKYRT